MRLVERSGGGVWAGCRAVCFLELCDPRRKYWQHLIFFLLSGSGGWDLCEFLHRHLLHAACRGRQKHKGLVGCVQRPGASVRVEGWGAVSVHRASH